MGFSFCDTCGSLLKPNDVKCPMCGSDVKMRRPGADRSASPNNQYTGRGWNSGQPGRAGNTGNAVSPSPSVSDNNQDHRERIQNLLQFLQNDSGPNPWTQYSQDLSAQSGSVLDDTQPVYQMDPPREQETVISDADRASVSPHKGTNTEWDSYGTKYEGMAAVRREFNGRTPAGTSAETGPVYPDPKTNREIPLSEGMISGADPMIESAPAAERQPDTGLTSGAGQTYQRQPDTGLTSGAGQTLKRRAPGSASGAGQAPERQPDTDYFSGTGQAPGRQPDTGLFSGTGQAPERQADSGFSSAAVTGSMWTQRFDTTPGQTPDMRQTPPQGQAAADYGMASGFQGSDPAVQKGKSSHAVESSSTAETSAGSGSSSFADSAFDAGYPSASDKSMTGTDSTLLHQQVTAQAGTINPASDSTGHQGYGSSSVSKSEVTTDQDDWNRWMENNIRLMQSLDGQKEKPKKGKKRRFLFG